MLPISTAIFSSLNNNATSLAPIIVKDGFDVAGRTTMAYKESGVHEARERFIEEAGTSALWLGGIPAIRKIFDKTVFKKFGLNPNVDLRLLNNKGVQTLANNEAFATGALKQDLLNTAKNLKTFKSLQIAKVLVSTLIPFVLLVKVLPKFNQNLTKQLVEQEKKKQTQNSLNNNKMHEIFSKNPAFKAFSPKSNVSFTGGLAQWINPLIAAQKAQVNPVDNMLALDMGISGGRVANSRNKLEAMETCIREGGIIYFFFLGGKHIAKGLEKLSDKLFHTPINLDPKIIEGKDFIDPAKSGITTFSSLVKNSLADANVKSTVMHFASDKSEKGVVDFIDNQLKTAFSNGKFKNFTLEAARRTGLIDIKDGVRNPLKYVDTEALNGLHGNIKNFVEKAAKPELAENFVKKAKNIKRVAIVANMALCSLSLAYLLPKFQYFIREKITGTNEYPGLKAYKA